jgi:chromosome segregation ATPase
MLQKIQADIETKKLQIADLQKTIDELYSDENIIPKQRIRLEQFDKQCPRECGHFNGGNLSCRNHCDRNWYLGFDRDVEKRNIAIKKHITPLENSKTRLEKEIEQLELKSTLPYLRNELLTSITDYQELEKTDPQYRQKQIDMKKSIYKQSQKVDELETKFNWFGNIPTTQPKIITPDPIVKTTIDYEVNKKPLLILGALGLVGLFLIWRLK